jgi:hypothetical protein
VKKLVACALLGGFLYALSGCGSDPAQKVDNIVDCAKICSKRDSCVENTNVLDCTHYCEERVSENENLQAAADTCEKCIDDTTCTEALACWPSCSLVPTTSG